MKHQQQIDVKCYKADGFIAKYQQLVKNNVIPYQYSVMLDNCPDAEKSHVVQNFKNAANALKNKDIGDGFYGMIFQDSDAAKWIEAAAYSLAAQPDQQLEQTVDELIDIVAAAQDDDGYLNTYFTINGKDRRWTNLLEGHELYCAGHFMEAACGYFEATGKDKLLNVMIKNAHHIYNKFITQKAEGYGGHPEIELALLKMYSLTNDEKCFELAQHFINTRGVDTAFFEKEAQKRDWQFWGMNPKDLHYNQSHAPVRQQKDAVGHSVRAVYLYTAMADLASRTQDSQLLDACKSLWHSITAKRMYITGGIGSTTHGEAFTADYHLPNDTAYAESCASIGLMTFASRMLEIEPNSEYADIMELAFYNTVLAGIQLDGKRFFYVNPLECLPDITGKVATHRHTLAQRPGWYACACCPPNAARIISSFGKYAYGENANTAFCHMFAGGEVKFNNGMHIKCSTSYPYSFEINYQIINGGKTLAVRIPAYSSNTKIFVNSKLLDFKTKMGYAYIVANTGDNIKVVLNGDARRVYANTNVSANTNCVALMRGPLVYCFEGVDNNNDVLSLLLNRFGTIKTEEFNSHLLGGTVVLKASAVRAQNFDSNALYSPTPPSKTSCIATAVPYYTWANRGENQMRVWLGENINN